MAEAALEATPVAQQEERERLAIWLWDRDDSLRDWTAGWIDAPEPMRQLYREAAAEALAALRAQESTPALPMDGDEEVQLEGYGDRVQSFRAYMKGDRLCICGIPADTEPEDDESAHNCDMMGCPSIDHVLARFKLPAALLRASGTAPSTASPEREALVADMLLDYLADWVSGFGLKIEEVGEEEGPFPRTISAPRGPDTLFVGPGENVRDALLDAALHDGREDFVAELRRTLAAGEAASPLHREEVGDAD